MKNLFTFFCCFLFASASYAQGEANNWVFASGTSISWNTGVPVAFSNSNMYTWEGSACISNSAGNLLFYSNGEEVWNRNHQQMPNGVGLLGDYSATQSAIIVPWPGDTNKYFLFTQDKMALVNGFRYSVVDMNLQGGLGDVVAASKNTLLYTPSCEKVNVTRHSNGIDFWVATHQTNTNAFFTYRVTATGVDTIPVISNVGSIHNINGSYAGYMKFSPDGRKLGLCVVDSGFVEVFEFDKTTGMVGTMLFHDSNYYFINSGPYGLEFSPNSNVLYVLELAPEQLLFQYNLLSPNILSSRHLVADLGFPGGGALQLAVDKKIYAVRVNATSLAAINAPNVVGIGCGFQNNAIQLITNYSCKLGLPNFVQSYFASYSDFTVQNTCLGAASAFSVTNAGADSTLWNFGDIASGAANSSTLLNPSHVFSSADTFNVTLKAWKGRAVDSTVKQVIILPAPIVNAGTADNIFCAGDSTEVCATAGFVSYLWNNAKTDSCIQARQAGNYYVTVTDINGCTASSNHLAVNVYPLPSISISVNGDTLTSYNGVTYQWYWNGNIINGAIDNMYEAKQGGSYTVAITDTNGCSAVSNPVIISGINNLSPAFSVNVYPNPLEIGFWNVDCATNMLGSLIEIFDADGRLVFESKIIDTNSQIELNAQRGIYMLRISSANNAIVRKLIRM